MRPVRGQRGLADTGCPRDHCRRRRTVPVVPARLPVPDPQNPVKLDNRSARPAGTPFVYDGQLIRPAQVCVGGYGEAIALNRIVHCSPELYREESMRVLLPELLTGGLVSNPHGFHTVSAWGTRTLVDAKRYALDWTVLSRKAKARVGRLRQLWVSPTRPLN